MKSLQGHLLVSSPKLLEPNFNHTVVLIVEHNDQGALGLIINRPLETTVDMVWQQVSEVPCLSEEALHQGGPCEGTLMVLHGDASLSQIEVVSGVYFTMEKESIEHLVAGDEDGRPVKFFVGHSGWAPGQLEGELETGAWLVTPAVAELVFEPAEDLWNVLRRKVALQVAYPWLKPELIPDDPSLN
jgi:putative transcriptional regulator